jgi:hypothetical protein
MHTRLTFICLISGVALLSRLDFVAQADPQQVAVSPAAEPYSLSFAAGGYDAQGNFLGGTELMDLVAFQGKLYAGVGYWMDRPFLLSPWRPDPSPGAQVLVLDSRSSRWRQEVSFGQRDGEGALEHIRASALAVIQFHRFDASGNMAGPLAEMLTVGLDGKGGAAVYTQKSPGIWENTRLPPGPSVRALAVHYDPIDRTEKLYAGGGRDSGIIYSGTYDPSAPGRIRWNHTPEDIRLRHRVMSLVECNGALFAVAKPSIYRRNDRTKSWETIFSYPIRDQFDESRYASGFRAPTCVNDGKQGKETDLLTSFEGVSGDILKVDPANEGAIIELHTRQFLIEQWGAPPPNRDIIAGYNDLPFVKNSPSVWLFGLLAFSPRTSERNSAWFLSRSSDSTPQYELHQVRPLPWPNRRSDSALWSVRAIAVSPFAEDQGKVLYLGGYDGHFKPDHNTAWLYRVGIATALEPYRGVAGNSSTLNAR